MRSSARLLSFPPCASTLVAESTRPHVIIFIVSHLILLLLLMVAIAVNKTLLLEKEKDATSHKGCSCSHFQWQRIDSRSIRCHQSVAAPIVMYRHAKRKLARRRRSSSSNRLNTQLALALAVVLYLNSDRRRRRRAQVFSWSAASSPGRVPNQSLARFSSIR